MGEKRCGFLQGVRDGPLGTNGAEEEALGKKLAMERCRRLPGRNPEGSERERMRLRQILSLRRQRQEDHGQGGGALKLQDRKLADRSNRMSRLRR